LVNISDYRESGRGRSLNPRKVPGGRDEIERITDAAAELIVNGLAETCALDVADRVAEGQLINFAVIGNLLNIDRERARQIAGSALARLRVAGIDVGKRADVEGTSEE
jgi:hypothetical protein